MEGRDTEVQSHKAQVGTGGSHGMLRLGWSRSLPGFEPVLPDYKLGVLKSEQNCSYLFISLVDFRLPKRVG
jgi:hypothetical protein